MLQVLREGSGPTVLLLHGFALDARMWRPQLEALRGTHHVVAPDLPGFGPSAVDVGERAMASAVADLLQTVSDEPAHVVGLSLGGAVAIDLALAFPRRVRSLVLLDALLLGRRTGIRAWPDAVARAKAGDLAGAREAWLGDDLFSPARARPSVAGALREMVGDYSCAHWCDRASTRFEVSDPAPRLRELDVPALVLTGEEDAPSFQGMADEYAAALPRATRERIPGAGHLCNLEVPDVVNARLARFFASA